jgi:hypothetical protein
MDPALFAAGVPLTYRCRIPEISGSQLLKIEARQRVPSASDPRQSISNPSHHDTCVNSAETKRVTHDVFQFGFAPVIGHNVKIT